MWMCLILTNEKLFSENYMPMRVLLLFAYKFTENESYCRFRLFSELFKLKKGILPLLTKYVSSLEDYLSYEAKIFLVN